MKNIRIQEHEFESDASDFSNESDSITSPTTISSNSSDDSNINSNEVLLYNNQTFTFPKNILDNPMIFKEFFSIETWRSLPENYKLYLKKKFLPNFPDDNLLEQEKCVQMLFTNNIRRFNTNVLIEVYKRLEEGNFRPEIYRLRKSIAKSRRREQRFKEYERISQLAKYLMIAREKLLSNTYNRPLRTKRNKSIKRGFSQNIKEFSLNETLTAIKAKQRYCKELNEMAIIYGITEISDDEMFENNSLKSSWEENNEDFDVVDNTETRIIKTTKRKKISNVLESSSCLLNSKTLKEALIEHKRRKLEQPDRPEMDTNDIRLRDIYSRTQISFEVKKSVVGSTDNEKLNNSPGKMGTLTKHSQKLNKNTNVGKRAEMNYFLFSESEDDDVLHNKRNPALNEAFLSSKNAQHLSSENVIKSEIDDFELKKESSILQPYQGKVSAATASDLEGIDMMGLPVDLDDSCDLDIYSELSNVADQTVIIKDSSPIAQATSALSSNPLQKVAIGKPLSSNKGLNQDTHACFLSLLRDIFCSTPNHRMKMEDLKEKIKIWSSGPIAALNEWYSQSESWYSLVPSAINFLTGEYFEPQDDFVPYIEYKINLNIYQWIGAGRDTDNHLLALCKQWLVKKSMSMDSQIGKNSINEDDGQTICLPKPRSQTTWKVRPATMEEITDFQNQERLRFEQAHKSFTYKQYGYESIVGPVKGIYAPINNLSKTRNINRSAGNRPNYITVLTLVRDATARLPNGEGTKNDICELLKSSQYINLEANEKELHSIVTGALDRMLTEKPPCVKYDETRKLWIYMHRNKSESEFDLLHNQNQLKSALNRKANTTKKVKGQITPTTSIVRSISTSRINSIQSITKPPIDENDSNKQSKLIQINKAPIQKVVMTQSPNMVNIKSHALQAQQVKVVTTSGIQTVNVSTITTSHPQNLPLSSSNQMKPILISTSSSNNSPSQQSFILPVISNSLVDDQPPQQSQQIKVLSNTNIIGNSNVLSSKFIKGVSTSGLGLRTISNNSNNQISSVVSRNLVRLTNTNLQDSKSKIVSIQNPPCSQAQRSTVTKTISIVKNAVTTPNNISQKMQSNQMNKKIISLSELQPQQKNVIIQQAVQGGQLIHKIINVAPSTSQSNQNIINPQIIQIQPPSSISTSKIQTINFSPQSNIKGNIGKQGNNISADKLNMTSIRTIALTNKNQIVKPVNNISKVMKPSTQAITSPVMSKAIGNPQNQIITLDSIIQKQAVSTGQSVRLPSPALNIAKSQPSTTNLIQITSNSQGQVTQYAVVSGATSSTLHKVQNTSTTSTNASHVIPKIIQTIGGPQIFNTKIISKSATNMSPVNTIRMVNATNLNLGNLKGKSLIIASASNSKQTTTSTTSSSSNQVFIQNSNMVLSNAGMKLQGNVLTSGNVQIVDQIVPRTTTLLSSSATTTVASSNVGTMTVNTANLNNPRTVVIGSSRSSELPTQATIKTISAAQPTSQHLILGNAVKNQQMKTPSGQPRIVLAVQGGTGQLLLPQHFQGGTLNLKSLQGLKVVSLAGNNSGNNIQPQTKK